MRGFTLIEMMVVLVILGVLVSLVVIKVMDRPDDARILKVKHDIRTIKQALELYKLDNYTYPSTDQGLEALITKPQGQPEPRQWKMGGYLEKLPEDPWGGHYLYLNPGIRSEIDIYSLGADQQAGGTGINADIGNWQLQ